jgi:hypothetical protein
MRARVISVAALASAVVWGAMGIGLSAHASLNSDGAGCEQRQSLFRDPFALYGRSMSFEVLRNGAPVGRHDVTFARRGEDLVVDSRFDVTVRFLGMAVYRYAYRSVDVWRGGCLQSLNVEIDEDGVRTTIEARREGEHLIVRGPKGEQRGLATLIPTNHWSAAVLTERQVLNTITGTIDTVVIVDRGETMRPMNGAVRPARHYAYTGDLTTEVWYDGDGRWVGLAFKGQDGSDIEFVCRRCGDDASVRR